MTTALNVIGMVCFCLAIVGCAALILWVRDRRWGREQVSSPEGQGREPRFRRGVRAYFTVGHIAAGVSFLAAAFHTRNRVSFISYLAASLYFFWLAMASIRAKKVPKEESNLTLSETFKEGARPPGAPPPIG